MGFFDLPPAPEPPDPEELSLPEWWGPPETEVPGVVPVAAVLARTDEVVVWIERIDAYSSGFAVAIQLLFSKHRKGDEGLGMHWQGGGAGLPEDQLRIGVRFADGAKATNLDPWVHRDLDDDEEPSTPVMLERGGGGGGRSWSTSYWIWPLPDQAPLELVVEWPAFSIPVTTLELPADAIRQASARAQRYFAD